MCFQEAIDTIRGKESFEDRSDRKAREDAAAAQENALVAQKNAIEAQARREKELKDSEMAQSRRDAVAASEKMATDSTKDTPEKRKRKKTGLESLRINKVAGLGGPIVGSGLIVG